ncbi:hypothetical protein KQX54_006127 [Cotesia glomerata]|uniref:Uncharacterized protein n=1 Tax=Cotesia glomerata TaxID=32391 RepID=A0AAV7I9S2_COTGL|nr:hypothetical protein KQX54_006127 [Cotesia glomerata]
MGLLFRDLEYTQEPLSALRPRRQLRLQAPEMEKDCLYMYIFLANAVDSVTTDPAIKTIKVPQCDDENLRSALSVTMATSHQNDHEQHRDHPSFLSSFEGRSFQIPTWVNYP